MTLKEMRHEDETRRVVVAGRADHGHTDNSVSTAKYTLLTFLPIAIREQFRRNGNVYFLVMGILMAIGWYTDYFDSAISPWTTLGPLAIVVSISLAQEGAADLARHRSDAKTNRHPCVVLARAADLAEVRGGGERDDVINNGKDVKVRLGRSYFNRTAHPADAPDSDAALGGGLEGIDADTVQHGDSSVDIAFQKIKRKNIRVGHIVLVRNREMIPADIILLASSTEGGTAYVETSSIDGETNLKLRSSPHVPKQSLLDVGSTRNLDGEEPPPPHMLHETLAQATKRMARFSALGYPGGISATANASNPMEAIEEDDGGGESQGRSQREPSVLRRASLQMADALGGKKHSETKEAQKRYGRGTRFISALTSEPPNASVNTYSGKMSLPPIQEDQPSIDIPLNAENILLRGAVLRNTEWAIGLACFTGTDTKLVQNQFETPSKFSRLDHLINRTVILILSVMLICVLASAALSVYTYGTMFDTLWYVGYNANATARWPYLSDLPEPQWDAEAPVYGQQVFLFVTLLNNFVPLSLYVTVEVITLFMMYLINRDREMYHDETDTRAVARSTIVTDLGQIQYIFSDKTGTLTQNVMRFKRCSVDGMAFGAPIEKSNPNKMQGAEKTNDADVPTSAFHPLKRLLVGAVSVPEAATSVGLEGLGDESNVSTGNTLTFNAEMFLRVMSICHTVVVEKDLDKEPGEDDSSRESKASSLSSKMFFSRLRSRAGTEASVQSQLGTVNEENDGNETPTLVSSPQGSVDELNLSSVRSSDSQRLEKMKTGSKSAGGAPQGYAYQAESPDEGALVSAASLTYGFQLLGRSSAGIQLACQSPSLLSQEDIAEGLKNQSISPKALAAQSASPALIDDIGSKGQVSRETGGAGSAMETRYETWDLLAVNKFDSDRKRMSVLVRSPPDLGSIPMLLCKGADSAMMDEKVCKCGQGLMQEEGPDSVGLQSPKASTKSQLSSVAEIDDNEVDRVPTCVVASREEGDWDMSTMLGLQAHLGDFASEGLRTLVLGVRILSEEEVDDWLARYKSAAKSIKDREKKLTSCALDIERDLHIVGATAIEDKLQDGVPETIHNLEKAGIKLWVLTGDKRETAIEIGYSTKVLTPRMHLTVVSDGHVQLIRAQMAMEFIRLIKYGKLTQYRRDILEEKGGFNLKVLCNWKKCFRTCRKVVRRTLLTLLALLKALCCFWRKASESDEDRLNALTVQNQDVNERRQAVRKVAEKIIHEYMESPEGMQEFHIRRAADAVRQSQEKSFDNDEAKPFDGASPTSRGSHKSIDLEAEENLSLTSDDVPAVFNRASSARAMLDLQRSAGKLTASSLRALSIASVTSHSITAGEEPIVDEDVLSLASFVPGRDNDIINSFDKKKRTVLERLFAVDRDVRKGHLNKHLTDEMMNQIHAAESVTESKGAMVEKFAVEAAAEESPASGKHSSKKEININAPRALVIEGAALAHLLGDPLLEELLFAVASCCDAVIACRVSPKQKALLVKLVRNYVTPTPVTLAIGDGANDVGMIQEAHVGVGISGLEGQQAVNASDFAIAQFRFLQDLVLIHGRWNFLRMARVVLFSFYKNAVMAGTMIAFGQQCLYSGTPLYDMWVISMLNFVAGIPILFLGMFDRDLDRDYVKSNPIVYKSGPNNEHLTLRVSLRWVCLTVIHIFTIYSLSEKPLALGGGVTSAFSGLMHNAERDWPGDGEGGDLKVFGLTIFSVLIFTLAYKVLYESRSIVNGVWPACTCRKGIGQGWPNRVAWTWVGVLWGSIGFFFFAMYTYQLIGRSGASSMSPFVMVANHTYNMRSITWIILILVPTAACVFDVVGKVFGNMYYPTQTQIHCEIQAAEITAAKREAIRRQMNNEIDLEDDSLHHVKESV